MQNVAVVCLDSVREDIFDDVAVRVQDAADISSDGCRAASSWSTPSHASMLSGLLAHEHGVHTHSRSFASLPRERTVFDDLTEYRTVGVSSNVYAGPAHDFDRYFDEFFPLGRGIRFPDALDPYSFDGSLDEFRRYALACVKSEKPVRSLFNGALELLDSTYDRLAWLFDEGAKPGLGVVRRELASTDEPTFVFLNLMEAHIPHRPARYLDDDLYECPRGWSSAKRDVWDLFAAEYDERYWGRRNGLYRAAVEYLDRRLSEFFDELDGETTVVVTADHGDNLGTEADEGLANHKSSLSERLLHVPLYLINPPEVAEQTGRYLSHLSLPDLIRGIRDDRVKDLSRDRAFAELAGMSAGPDPEADYEYYDRAIRCAYDGDQKVVWSSLGTCTRYDLPGEANTQRASGSLARPPSWATRRFGRDISTFKHDAVEGGTNVSVDPSTAARLRNLGYF
ncbi:sulfatase-like hydrolase/transferase [Salinigranum salinum]|uniref:sulfatase-like hydrolase/transferase n=1 Tax=Salinigranum salinum TaxID=1364937 RepID=UPI0012609112|nr:sulfatase-like hydrolase/transferase [Salinigranum salinum]